MTAFESTTCFYLFSRNFVKTQNALILLLLFLLKIRKNTECENSTSFFCKNFVNAKKKSFQFFLLQKKKIERTQNELNLQTFREKKQYIKSNILQTVHMYDTIFILFSFAKKKKKKKKKNRENTEPIEWNAYGVRNYRNMHLSYLSKKFVKSMSLSLHKLYCKLFSRNIFLVI